MTDDHPKRTLAVSAWWVLVIIVPICTIVLWIAVDHANQAQDAAQHRANQQFRKALLVTDRKFQQALRVTTNQFAYATNKSVCGFRKIADDGISRSRKVLKDPTATHATRVAAQRTINQATAFKTTQVTIPTSFDCNTLPSTAPKPKVSP